MYYEPCCLIRIGSDTKYLEFESVNKVVIVESVKTLGNKATIVLPRNFKKVAGKSIKELLSPGDPVKIWLGYDEKLHEEFRGFLQEVESGAPLTLHVDDEFYPLKRNNIIKAWKSISLKELLEYIAPGYTINCPDVQLGAFSIDNLSTFRVLIYLQENYGFYSSLKNNVLTCLWPFDIGMSEVLHTYEFYTITVKNNKLKYRRAEDVKLRVKATSIPKNGSKPITYEVGNKEHDSSLYEIKIPEQSYEDLKKFADAKYKQLCFNGYSGSITGFGNPRTHAGDTLKIVDKQEPDREGNYLIEAVTITYDVAVGFERENTLSFKV